MVGVRLQDTVATDVAEYGTYLASLGYERVWAGELWDADAFVQLTAIAQEVKIAVGTAIVNVFSRTPAVLAQAATTLADISDGSMTLGLGVSTPKAIEDLHGMKFEQPIRRTHETVELIQRFTRGEGRVNYSGEIFDVADFPALDAEVSVYNAALGEANRRVTGRLCDGWIPHNIPFTHLDETFDSIRAAAEDADRDPGDITVAPYVPTAVSQDPAEARAALRGHIAYYVGSGEGYRRAVGIGFPDEADAIAEAWRGGDRETAREAVSASMLEALGIAGTEDEARDQLRSLLSDSIIDEPIIVPPASLNHEAVERTVSAVAPPL